MHQSQLMYCAGVADVTPDPSPLELLALLADPLRWELVRQLARSDRRVHELTTLCGRPQNLVSYHLRELRSAGLVAARRSSADGRDTYYRVDLARCGRLLGATGAALHPGLQLGVVPAPSARTPTRPAPRVLFLCTGNSARSQMAEALTEEVSGHTVLARSAGSHPKALHPNAVRAMAVRGIDIGDRTAKHLRRFSRLRFDHVITLCDRVREVCPELPGHPETAHWSIPDPARAGDSDEATYPAFERTAEELETRIRFLLAELTAPTAPTAPTDDEEPADA
jgi:protein-tyrosine-phosphatase/DNA-binding transcriptional ArsR family regulator